MTCLIRGRVLQIVLRFKAFSTSLIIIILLSCGVFGIKDLMDCLVERGVLQSTAVMWVISDTNIVSSGFRISYTLVLSSRVLASSFIVEGGDKKMMHYVSYPNEKKANVFLNRSFLKSSKKLAFGRVVLTTDATLYTASSHYYIYI